MVDLSGIPIYCCSTCRTPLATAKSVLSRMWIGHQGPAYLLKAVFNTVEGDLEDRQMTTGVCQVRNLSCAKCGQLMGWKYEHASAEAQKYKEGKSVLDKTLLIEETTHGASLVLPFSSTLNSDEDAKV